MVEYKEDYIQQIKELFKKDYFAVSNGMELTEVRPGYATAHMNIEKNHLNGYGTVQGGAMFTLADYAFAAASNAMGSITVSSGASISFFKPPKGSFITAKAEAVSSGRRLCTYNVDVFDEDGTLLARYNGNGYIMNKPTLGE